MPVTLAGAHPEDWFFEEEEPRPRTHDWYTICLVEAGYLHPRTHDLMWELPPLVRLTDILSDFYITPMLAELSRPATPFLDLLREEAL